MSKMTDPFTDIFGGMLLSKLQHSKEEYFFTIQELENILHARGGNIRTSRILQYTKALKDFESNMKSKGASSEQLNSFYREALKELYPVLANVRSR